MHQTRLDNWGITWTWSQRVPRPSRHVASLWLGISLRPLHEYPAPGVIGLRVVVLICVVTHSPWTQPKDLPREDAANSVISHHDKNISLPFDIIAQNEKHYV
jgi:hypothetical protein